MNNRLAGKVAIICLILGLFLTPSVLHAADLEITEISYNPDGSDADYEWLEIHSTTGSPIDLAGWSFYENDTNHTINDTGDGLVLPAGDYAVIARSPDTFSPRHSVDLLAGSSFSLVNGGEEIALRSPAGSVVGAVAYDPSVGADGDGDSLQLISGSWVAADPTPGEVNSQAKTTAEDDPTDEGSSSSGMSGSPIQPRSSYSATQNVAPLSVSAYGDTHGWAGIPISLSGEVTGGSEYVTATWSLGNGDERAGTSTTYTYHYPGEYVVTFTASDDGQTASDEMVVDVIALDLSLEIKSGAEGFIKIHNETSRDVDLSGWSLESSESTFVLPEHSTGLANGELIVPNRVSGFSELLSVSLYRKGGRLATSTQSESVGSVNSVTYTSSGPSPTTVVQAAATSAATSTDDEGRSGRVLGTTSAAAAAVSTGGDFGTFLQWGFLLMALLLAAIGTVILMRRVSKPADKPEVQAAKFDINEINE